MDTFRLTDHSKIIFQKFDLPDRLEGHSDKEKNFYHTFYEQKDNPLKDLRTYQYRLLIEEIGLKQAFGNHLDIGCGDGLFVELCRHLRESESIGIDAYAPQHKPFIFRKSLEDYISDTSRESKDQKFDVISFLDVLEHFQNPSLTLNSVKKLMTPATTLIIKVPSKNSLLYRLAKIAARIIPQLARGTFIRMYQVNYPPPHYSYYNFVSLKSLLEQNGFEVEMHGYISETPLRTLKKRLWNIKKVYRPAAFVVLFLMQIFTPKSMYDGLYVTARLK
ncbi:MAG: class I SAM-dependent methyltransferase [Proteobacteria bacterium]|nr:MAG: class I SAM-dependent methyltransferase [Pseudomonadota bacterium]